MKLEQRLVQLWRSDACYTNGSRRVHRLWPQMKPRSRISSHSTLSMSRHLSVNQLERISLLILPHNVFVTGLFLFRFFFPPLHFFVWRRRNTAENGILVPKPAVLLGVFFYPALNPATRSIENAFRATYLLMSIRGATRPPLYLSEASEYD